MKPNQAEHSSQLVDATNFEIRVLQELEDSNTKLNESSIYPVFVCIVLLNLLLLQLKCTYLNIYVLITITITDVLKTC